MLSLYRCFDFFQKKLIYKEKCETVKEKNNIKNGIWTFPLWTTAPRTIDPYEIPPRSITPQTFGPQTITPD